MNKKTAWEEIGFIGVDAGICWIGDPCYIHLDPEYKEEPPKEWGKTWDNFCNTLAEKEGGDYPTAVQFNYDKGHPGLGVCVSTGYGDGYYPVFIKRNKEGRISEVKVKFI
jgi:hypothetical protein